MKKLDLRKDPAAQIGAIAKLAKSGVGTPVSGFEMEVPNDPVEGESQIPTVNLSERVSEIDATIADTQAELEQAKLDIAAAAAELDIAQEKFFETFEAHEIALANASEVLETTTTRVESLDGDIAYAVSEAYAARDAALAAGDEAALAAALFTVAEDDPTAADGEGKPVGAIWEVRSGDVTVRRYVLTDESTWTQVKLGTETIGDAVIGSAQIGELDVAKLTASGTSKFQTAVMKALIADQGFFQNLYANNVVVAGENLLPDPLMKNPAAWRNDSRLKPDGGYTGGASVQIPASASQVGIYNAQTSNEMPYAVRVTPGQRYRISAWFKSVVAGVGTTNKIALYHRYHDANGVQVLSATAAANAVIFSADTWTPISGVSLAAPDNAAYMSIGLFVQSVHNSQVTFSDPSVRAMADGDLIVENSIKARHIVADEVAAAVGTFIDAMMTNLSVTGVAAIKQVTTDALWAKLAVVDRLQVLSSIITEDMIATGAVTAEKVVASQALIDKLITPDLLAGKISTDMFQLGENWRWTDSVFGAYLPVTGDQPVTDWESRVPAFEVTPSGTATYTVYQDGEPTAGMQPDGTVWGTNGDFNEISVGGKPLAEVMSPYPLGMIYGAALRQDVGLGVTTETRLLNAQVRMYAGRTYRVVMQLAYIDTGRVNLRVRQSASGIPVVGNTLQTEVSRDGTGGGRGLIHYDYILRSDDLSEAIPEDGLVVNIGMFVSMSGWAAATVYGAYPVSGAPGKPRTMLTVEDMGASLDMDWVTVANNVPAPAPNVSTYSKTATYKGGWGWRGVAANGAIHPNNRATVGGALYGTAMNNLIVVGVSNMTTNLSGATVTKATVTVKRAAGGTASTVYWNIGFSSNGSAPTSSPSVTNIATNAAFTVGQSRTFTLTAAQANNLRTGAFRSVVVSPTYSGSSSSYGYLDVTATKVDYTYKK